VKAPNSELVLVHLFKSYCLPFLLYASEAVLPSNNNVQSLDNCINHVIFKIFGLNSNECIQAIRQSVSLPV